MAKNILIVESPAKASTINRYLGTDFQVLASFGHVRDLIPKNGAVDTDNDFKMNYEIIARNAKHVDAIVKAIKKGSALYLATDLDREGEAISWHIYEILREKGLLKDKEVFRVVFSEITRRAIEDAVANPRALSMDMVNAQQARRALDYLVGFNLSPLLWKKVRRGLSAGRVQSPALRLIVEREAEIRAFDPQEYWTIEADLEKETQPFMAKLSQFHGEKLKQFDINNEEKATQALQELKAAGGKALKVAKITRKQRKRRPAPPFITSTLQQEAARKLGFGAQRSMRIAQQLYEGVAVDGEQTGLITYMRTDSVVLSQEALGEIRATIARKYGADNVPQEPNFYKTKSKNAQEAHEAVRPTAAARDPKTLSSALTPDQLKLYSLIWKRTMACQMINATLDTVSVDLACGDGNSFRASGSTVVTPGFLSVYEEGKDDQKDKKDEKRLPAMEEGELIPLKTIRPEQHFTEPPPRYGEASLIKTLEEHGIGRPSTYAAIISTLLAREYVELEKKRFTPTDTGNVVANFLTNHFNQYVDYEFTARLEDELDEVSRGEKEWVPVMEAFWRPFEKLIEEKTESVSPDEARMKRELGTDPKSGRPISVRLGRYGAFVQIGTRDDEEKPTFASLRQGQKLETLTFEEAIELFKLPRSLGETDEGEPVSAAIGRFGPYVRFGSKFVSIKEEDPFTITLEEALVLVKEKKEWDANRVIKEFKEEEIQVLRGRYGPYITDGNKNGKIPKDKEPEDLTLEECIKLLAEAPVRGRGKKKAGKKKASAKKTASKKTSAKKTGKKKASKKKAGKKKATKKKAG